MLQRHSSSRVRVLLISLLCGGAWLTGCAKRNVGDAVRPDAQTAGDALGQPTPACPPAGDRAAVLVVDWDAHARADFEIASKNGLVAIRYACDEFEIIPECTVPDEYTFTAVTPKQELLKIESYDELGANLPIGAAKLGGELERGRSLDLAFMLVGKKNAAHGQMARTGLPAGCEQATHVVRGISIGAFALSTNTKGSVSTAAEAFDIGVGAKSDSSRSAVSTDGDVNACRSTDLQAMAPPEGCGSAIRLDLRRLAERSSTRGEEPAPLQSPCPEPLELIDGSCQHSSIATCQGDDATACQQSCDAGNGESCFNLALLQSDANTAMELLERACEVGVDAGCAELTRRSISAIGANVREFKAEALRLEPVFSSGCAAGSGTGCARLADAALYRDDATTHFNAAMKSCRLGNGPGCRLLSSAYRKGTGTAKDPSKAVQTLYRACIAGEDTLCSSAARSLRLGTDGVKDLTKAAESERVLCLPEQNAGACLSHGQGLTRDDKATSLSFHQEICSKLQRKWACDEATLLRQ